MASQEFTLKSGAHLRVTTAAFERAIALVEAVEAVLRTMDPGLDDKDPRVTSAILSNPAVRNALFPVMDTVTYNEYRVTPGLFDEPKVGEQARGDYFELCARVIEVNRQLFFSPTSSGSITPHPGISAARA